MNIVKISAAALMLPLACTLCAAEIPLGEVKCLENGNWSASVAVERRGNAKMLLPHSVGEIKSYDWEKITDGKVFVRCRPGWGMTYRMLALLNEFGDSRLYKKERVFTHHFFRPRRRVMGRKK